MLLSKRVCLLKFHNDWISLTMSTELHIIPDGITLICFICSLVLEVIKIHFHIDPYKIKYSSYVITYYVYVEY